MNSATGVDKRSEGDNNSSTIMDDVIIVDTTTSSPSSSSTLFMDSKLTQQTEEKTILGSRILSYAFKRNLRHLGNILVSIHHPSQSVIVTFCDGAGGCSNNRNNKGEGKEEKNISSLGGGLYHGSIPLEIFKPFLFDSLEDGEKTITKDDTEIQESLRTILIGQQPPASSSAEQQQPESNLVPASDNGKISGLHLSIQLKQKENDTYITHSFELILGRTNKAGIVQHLYKEVMKRYRIKDSNNNNVENGTVPFCTMTGIALNDALRQIQELKSTIHIWQDNSKRLDDQRQNDRDRLFENFNKFRLDMILRHKKEVLDLQTKHDDEIRTIKSSIPSIDATKTNKRHRDMLKFDNPNKDDEEDKNDDNIRLPFSDTDGMLLKDGKATSKTRHQAARKRVLGADEATDMTKLYKEADNFARSMKKTKKTTNRMITKRHSKKQQQQLSKHSSSSSSSSDSDSDVEETKESARRKREKTGGSTLTRHNNNNKRVVAKRNEYDSTSSSNQSSSRQDVRSSSKINKSERRTARSQRISHMYDSDSDTDVGEQGGDEGKKFTSENKTKNTGTSKRRQMTVEKSTMLNDSSSSSDTDLGENSDVNINNSEDKGGESKPAPTTKGNRKQEQQVNQKKSNGEAGCSSDSSGNFKW